MRRPRLCALLLALSTLSVPDVSARDCAGLTSIDGGVPAEYYIEECKGLRALEHGQFSEAETHFKKALSVPFFEAPNYELKVELGRALCSQGKTRSGRHELQEFICMAEVDLGRRQCTPEQASLPKPSTRACAEICEAMSPLSDDGRADHAKKLGEAVTQLKRCGSN